jgi:hypothetical protein
VSVCGCVGSYGSLTQPGHNQDMARHVEPSEVS